MSELDMTTDEREQFLRDVRVGVLSIARVDKVRSRSRSGYGKMTS